MSLPDKQYFKIGEVARLAGVKTSVLRFWETEFPSIRPEKTRSGQRTYSRKNVERILQIRELLYEQRFTIAGARRRLREPGAGEDIPKTPAPRGPDPQAVAKIRKEVHELLQLARE